MKVVPRLDAGEADPRHAVHLERHDQAVPVDRGVLVQPVLDREADILAFLEADQRRRNGAVDRDGVALRPSTVKLVLGDGEANVLAAERALRLGRHAVADALCPGGLQPGRGGQRDAAAEERPAVEGNRIESCGSPRSDERKTLVR